MIRSRFLASALIAALALFTAAPAGFTAAAATTGVTTVTISDNVFTPANIGVTAGATVTWTNYGAQIHTVTADNAAFDSGDLSNGASFSYTFNTPGVFKYYCKHHGGPNGVGMSGIVTVTASSNSSSGTSTTPSNLSVTGNSSTTTSTLVRLLAPVNVTASGTSASTIALSWTDANASSSSSTVTGFNIIRNGSQVATAATPSYNDTGLNASTTYSYNVSAYNGSGSTSPWSATVYGTTLGPTPNTGTTTTATTTAPITPPNPVTGGIWGWAAIPLSLFNLINGAASTGASTTPVSPYTYNNGYPMMNGNYVDCNGNIDNDPAHHTTDPYDKDPGHHIGMSCPNGGMPLVYGNNNQGWWSMGGGMGAPGNFTMHLLNGGGGIPWVVIPLNPQTLQQLLNAINNNPSIQPSMRF